MKKSSKAVGGFFLAALLSSPAWGSVPPQPGTVNYIEGQAAIGAQALTEKSMGSASISGGPIALNGERQSGDPADARHLSKSRSS